MNLFRAHSEGEEQEEEGRERVKAAFPILSEFDTKCCKVLDQSGIESNRYDVCVCLNGFRMLSAQVARINLDDQKSEVCYCEHRQPEQVCRADKRPKRFRLCQVDLKPIFYFDRIYNELALLFTVSQRGKLLNKKGWK